jgi:uncharacterized membrane protein
MNPLNSVKGAITTAFVLAIVVSLVLTNVAGVPKVGGAIGHEALTVWLHVLSGVMWIGLLYYFNVVQIPGLAAAGADKGGPGGAGISKYIAPVALLWFRWAAVATWVTGAAYLAAKAGFVDAFLLGTSSGNPYHTVIGLGAWLGTIMAINVWVLIWPNQKKVLGMVPATDEEKAKARKTAMLASRTNFVLSVPMLMCMVGAHHYMAF